MKTMRRSAPGRADFTARKSSIPVMPGMCRSHSTRSKSPWVRSIFASAASVTTRTWKSPCSRRASARATSASSSTMSTLGRPGFPSPAGPLPAAAKVAGKGRCTRKVAPFPGSLSASTVPPRAVMMPRVMKSPSPVPCPTGRVVKNGSKTFIKARAPMPSPLSRTSTTACPSLSNVVSSRTFWCRRSGARASAALPSSSTKACSSRLRSQRTGCVVPYLRLTFARSLSRVPTVASADSSTASTCTGSRRSGRVSVAI